MALQIVKYSWRKCSLPLVLICAIGVVSFGALGQAAAPDGKVDDITIAAAVAMDSSPTRLALTMKNDRKNQVNAVGIGTKQSRLLLKTPDGREIEHALIVDHPGRVQVPAQGSYTWQANISQILRKHKLKEAGTYWVTWKLMDRTSNPVPVHLAAVTLSVGIEVGSSPPNLVFALRNGGKKPLSVNPFNIGPNRIIVVGSDGKERDTRMSTKAAMIAVPPSSTKTWRKDVSRYVTRPGLDKTQPCQVFWRVGNLQSPSIWFYPPAKE
jgi:hypothetical protein